MSVQITIRFEDGTLETVSTEAFVLTSFEAEDGNEEGQLSPKTYEFPPGKGWPVFEAIAILGERLMQEQGPVMQSIGMAVHKTMEAGRKMIASANEELRKSQADG